MPDVNVRAKAPSSLEHQLSESQRPIPGGSCRPYQATEYARTGFGAPARIESLGPAQLVRHESTWSFVGVHFLRTRMSSLLLGVGEDAEVISGTIAAWLRS